MSPEEAAVLRALFARLKAAETQPRDPAAERWIKDAVAAQPTAPYYMAQELVYLQQALGDALVRINRLEQAATQPARGGGLFGHLFGHHDPAPHVSDRPPVRRRAADPPALIGPENPGSAPGDAPDGAGQGAAGAAMGMMAAGAIGGFLVAGAMTPDSAPPDDGDGDSDGGDSGGDSE